MPQKLETVLNTIINIFYTMSYYIEYLGIKFIDLIKFSFS